MMPSILWGDHEGPSAFMAECAALCMALLPDMMRFPHQPITFVTDCKAALDCANGAASSGSLQVQGVMRSLAMLRRASSRGPVRIIHTQSHKGEFVDTASKLASRGCCAGTIPFPDGEFWCRQRGQNLLWASTACRALQGSVVMPPVDGSDLGHDRSLHGLTAEEVLGAAMPISPHPSWQPTAFVGTLAVRIASFNVLSLSGSVPRKDGSVKEVGLAMQIAKPFLLAESFRDNNVAVAALQETRCEQGLLSCGDYLRFCSGAQGGMFGNELWFRLGHVFVLANGSRLSFEKESFCTRHAGPRRLFVLYTAAKTRVVFVSLHASYRATEWPVVQTWWQETARLCSDIIGGQTAVICGDMNATVGEVTSLCIGDLAEPQDPAGSLWHVFLEDFHLWLPATFEGIHMGCSWTYAQKRGGQVTRIDFVALPRAWQDGQVASWIEPTVHAGQPVLDHLAVICDVTVKVGFHAACPQAATTAG